MEQQEYLEKRVDGQIDWHDRKSQWNQRCFKRIQVITITAAALVPMVSSFVVTPWYYKIAIGGLGVVAAVTAGILGFYRFQELWFDYRVTAESLRSEKFRYETRVAPYDGDDAFQVLVDRTEAVLNQQCSQWRKH